MSDVTKVGDTVRAIHQLSGTKVEGTISSVAPSHVEIDFVFTLQLSRWDIAILKRASNIPTEPGQYNVRWANGIDSPWNPWTIGDTGSIIDKDGDVNDPVVDFQKATWTRLPDKVWQAYDLAILDDLAWRKSRDGYWHAYDHIDLRILTDANMHKAKLILREGKEIKSNVEERNPCSWCGALPIKCSGCERER